MVAFAGKLDPHLFEKFRDLVNGCFEEFDLEIDISRLRQRYQRVPIEV